MELAIDSVGLEASVAVSRDGRPVAEITWPTGRQHTPSLLPMIDEVCRLAGTQPSDLTAISVDVGPGAYGGIRAGMAAAIGIALALDLPAVGVGRLEIEAYAHAAARDPIAAIHDAGRGQWALAIYQGPVDRWTEILPPTLCSPDELLAAARLRVSDGILCGEVATLPPDLLANLHAAGLRAGGSAAGLRRAALLAELGWRRRQAGGDFLPARLAPIYLREPAIGPQPQPVRPRKEQG